MTYLINSIAEMNLNNLYIDDKSLSYHELLKKFVLSDDVISTNGRDRANTQVSRPSSHSSHYEYEKDKDNYYNALAEYVKILINHFFSLMVRNLREAIPKITGYYYINSIKSTIRFYILSEITKEFAYEDYLEEDPEIAKNRNYFIDLMKKLKSCEKILSYDEDIKNAIKGDNSKNINKVAEKTLNEMNRKLNEGNNYSNSYNDESQTSEKSIESNKHNRWPSDVDKKILTNERRGSTNISNNIVNKEESKISATDNTITSNKSQQISQNTQQQNIQKQINQENQQSQNIQKGKYSMQNYLNDEQPVKKQALSSSSNPTVQSNAEVKKDPAISFKMDPNSNDIKDMKINVNMDAETAYNFYQANKKYLPTTQQVMSGAKATANFVEKNASAISVNEEETSNKDSMVTGSKVTQKKQMFDPLTSLFGMGTKKENKASSSNTSSANQNKKGQF